MYGRELAGLRVPQGRYDFEFAKACIRSSLAETLTKSMEDKGRSNLLGPDQPALQLIEDAIKSITAVGAPLLVYHHVLTKYVIRLVQDGNEPLPSDRETAWSSTTSFLRKPAQHSVVA